MAKTQKQLDAAYYRKNRKKIIKRVAEYTKKNKAKTKAWHRKWYQRKKADKQYILNKVNDGLVAQFEMYSWHDMINDCDLTPEQKAWAKENIDYRAYILG